MRILKRKNDASTRLLIPGAKIDHISLGAQNLWHINGVTVPASCMKCIYPLCIRKKKSSNLPENLSDFSYDQSYFVCPSQAIDLGKDGFPTIDQERCISCGLCVFNCPYAALNFDENYKISVNKKINNFICEENRTPATSEKQILQSSTATSVNKIGSHVNEKEIDNYVRAVYSNIKAYDWFNCPDYANRLVARLLEFSGYDVFCSRVGDVYNRMDAIIISDKGNISPMEIEFGMDALETIRALLDDIAILDFNFNCKAKSSKPIVVFLEMPNVRQGYWQDINDIHKVIGIKVYTLTLGVILSLTALRIKISVNSDAYYLSTDEYRIRHFALDSILKSVDGVLEPRK